MGDERYVTCKGCGRSVEEVGTLSWTRLCGICGDARFLENMAGMLTMRGPYATHWRRQMARSVGATLLDDLRESA